MASIIEGYEYDIIVSYHQNDNHSGCVTKFVETCNIDKSLEGKLKCLIFIPVISHTYCDPQSYAW
jgi:hypothetical protein